MRDGAAAACPRCERPLDEDGKCPSCDERKSDRLGDATLGRIAVLSEGWSMASATPVAGVDAILEVEEAGAIVDQEPRRADTVSEALRALEDTGPSPAPGGPPPIPKDAPPPRAATLTLPKLPAREEDTAFDPRSPVAEPVATPALERIVIKRGGALGDIAYVGNVIYAAVTGRREVASLKERLGYERAARERRLVELAKLAAADTKVAQAGLEEARARLRMVDEDLAQKGKETTEAEAEAQRADRALAEKLAELGRQAAELEKEIVALEREELAPLEAEAAARKRRLDDHKASRAETARRLAGLEKRLARATVTEPELRADAEVELAAVRAEEQALIREEPALDAAIRELEPTLADTRDRLEKLRARLARNRQEAAAETERLEFQAKAARGRKAEAERARKALAARKDTELVQLGEAIDRERPPELRLRLRPADEHGAAMAILERRILELEDASRVIDKGALLRGVVWLLALMGLAFAVTYLVA
jgi:hypothetical protein